MLRLARREETAMDGFDLDQAINRRFTNTSDGAAAGSLRP